MNFKLIKKGPNKVKNSIINSIKSKMSSMNLLSKKAITTQSKTFFGGPSKRKPITNESFRIVVNIGEYAANHIKELEEEFSKKAGVPLQIFTNNHFKISGEHIWTLIDNSYSKTIMLNDLTPIIYPSNDPKLPVVLALLNNDGIIMLGGIIMINTSKKVVKFISFYIHKSITTESLVESYIRTLV